MSKQKSILYIGAFELPDKNAAAHRVLNNAKIMRELGKNVIFVGISKGQNSNVDILTTKTLVQGFEAYSVAYPSNKKEWLMQISGIEAYRKVMDTIEELECVVFYNFYSVAMIRLMKYCRKCGIRCIADVTEWYAPSGTSLRGIIRKADVFLSMHFVHKKMDGIISISKFIKNYYRSVKKNEYIPALVDKNEAKWTIIKNARTDNCLRLVYAGNPGRKDRIDRLIEALKTVNRNYYLDVIGITKDDYLVMYPEHKAFLEQSSSIVFHGRLSHLETLQYVANADFACFFREVDRVSKAGFPTKFAEAISCGTPVITNTTSNLEDFTKDGKNCILLENNNPVEIAKVLNEVKDYPVVDSALFDYHNYAEGMKKIIE